MTGQKKTPHFIGSYMQDIEEEIRFYAKKRKSILLIGEPGTGKDLVATIAANESGLSVHEVNLTNFKGELAYSNLCGCEKDSHSKANAVRKGALEEADGKLCFLNEIGTSLDTEVQKALLRFIEQKNIVRLGGSHENPIKVDTYLIGACQSMESLGPDIIRRFERKIELPPLVWRVKRLNGKFISDILEIAQEHLIKRGVVMIKKDLAEKLLLMNSYPGNVGDLINLIDTECDIAERYWSRVNNCQHCPYGISVLFFSNDTDINNLIEKFQNQDISPLEKFIRCAGIKDLFALSQMYYELGTKENLDSRLYRKIGDSIKKMLKLQSKDPSKRKELSELMKNSPREYSLPAYVADLILYPFQDIAWVGDNWLGIVDLSKWQPLLRDIPVLPYRIMDDFNYKWRVLLKTDIAQGKLKENPYFYAIKQEYGKPSDSIEQQLGTKAPRHEMFGKWLTMPLRDIEKRAILERYRHFNKNKTRTAKSLDIDRTTLNKKLKKFSYLTAE